MRPWSHAVPRSALAFALLLGLLVAVGSPVAPASGASQSGGVARTSAPPVEMTVALQPDGDAVWNVTTTVAVESERDREAFDDLAAAFRRGEAPGPSADLFRRAAAAAGSATGREMRVRDVNRTAVQHNETGRLTLRFTWTNFARTPGDRIVVGDAFNTTNGTWLPGLTDGQTLVVEPPRGYNVESASIGPRNGVLRWEGPTTFEPDAPSVTYQRSGLPGTETPPGFELGNLSLIGVGLVALAVVVIAAYLWRRRGAGDEPGPGPAAAQTNGGSTGGAATDAAADAPADAVAGADVDEELLSDEERVEHLLERNGGRMKQADIVTETGWSNAKVSQLLTSMDESDRVNKLRIGRENLITLPDEDVAEFD
ncbi:MAG: helix-turn-helix transcriptional regulator [Haloarculaceae archaeon]